MSSVAFVPKFLRCNVTQYPIIYIYELRDQNSRKGAKKQRLLGDELRLSISFPNSNGDVDEDSYSRYLSCGVKFKCEHNFARNGIQSSNFGNLCPLHSTCTKVSGFCNMIFYPRCRHNCWIEAFV